MNGPFDAEPKLLTGATLSECGQYRYRLWRVWDECLPIMVFVMQNPSTADASEDDPTIRKCVGFAKKHGYGGVSVRNVFALRATDEWELFRHADPVGPLNHEHLQAARSESIMTRLVVAWGNRLGGKRFRDAYNAAAVMFQALRPYCLGTNRSGEPKHPLFVPYSAELVEWRPPR